MTYYGNDAGGPTAENVPPPQRVGGGESVTLSDGRPTRTGYRFLSWNSAPDGSGISYQPGQAVGPFYQHLTIYAQWQIVEHSLTYHGSDAGGPPAQNIPAPQPIYEDRAVPLSDMVPTREGFRFTGWNTRPDGGGAAYQPGASFGPAIGDADLYAQWAVIPPSIHTLTYCGNDAGGPHACCIPCPQQVLAGQWVRIPDCVPYRTCYCFAGWNTDPRGRGQAYGPGEMIGPIAGDVRLYAQWKRLPPPKPCCTCHRVPD